MPQSKPASKISLLSAPTRAEIDVWIAKYPPDHELAFALQQMKIGG